MGPAAPGARGPPWGRVFPPTLPGAGRGGGPSAGACAAQGPPRGAQAPGTTAPAGSTPPAPAPATPGWARSARASCAYLGTRSRAACARPADSMPKGAGGGARAAGPGVPSPPPGTRGASGLSAGPRAPGGGAGGGGGAGKEGGGEEWECQGRGRAGARLAREGRGGARRDEGAGGAAPAPTPGAAGARSLGGRRPGGARGREGGGTGWGMVDRGRDGETGVGGICGTWGGTGDSTWQGWPDRCGGYHPSSPTPWPFGPGAKVGGDQSSLDSSDSTPNLSAPQVQRPAF